MLTTLRAVSNSALAAVISWPASRARGALNWSEAGARLRAGVDGCIAMVMIVFLSLFLLQSTYAGDRNHPRCTEPLPLPPPRTAGRGLGCAAGGTLGRRPSAPPAAYCP